MLYGISVFFGVQVSFLARFHVRPLRAADVSRRFSARVETRGRINAVGLVEMFADLSRVICAPKSEGSYRRPGSRHCFRAITYYASENNEEEKEGIIFIGRYTTTPFSSFLTFRV